MKTKTHYDSLDADKTIQIRIPAELHADFKALFPRHGDMSRAIRDFITDTIVKTNENK